MGEILQAISEFDRNLSEKPWLKEVPCATEFFAQVADLRWVMLCRLNSSNSQLAPSVPAQTHTSAPAQASAPAPAHALASATAQLPAHASAPAHALASAHASATAQLPAHASVSILDKPSVSLFGRSRLAYKVPPPKKLRSQPRPGPLKSGSGAPAPLPANACRVGSQASYTFFKVKFKHFSSTFKGHFQFFPAPYRWGKIHIYRNIYTHFYLIFHFLSQLCTLYYAVNI